MNNLYDHAYEASERGFSAGYGIALMAFLVLVWAVGSKSGPLKDWADEHSSAAAALVLLLPIALGILFG